MNRAIVLLIGTTVVGCGAQPPSEDVGPFRFTDVSRSSGIEIENVCGDPLRKMAIPETLGQGAAAIDYDGDGRLDLFVVNGDVFPGEHPRVDPAPALYRNLGDMRFEDVTEASGLRFRAWGQGATRVDFDADGHDDLYVTVYGDENRFFRNVGDGRFEDARSQWGGADDGPSTAAAFFDADRDGDLDLYVGNYVLYDHAAPPNGGRPCEWRGLSVMCGPIGTVPAADRFFENRDGRLIEATEAFGFAAAASYALGAVTGDYDNDGDVDLYVANDSRGNYLFENLGDGRFREVSAALGVGSNLDGREQAGMGVDFGDLDNDGRFELFVTNFSHDSNTLYRNALSPDGSTYFEDATFVARLGLPSRPYLSWGAKIVDLDRDGWQDIVVVSGHVYPQVDESPVGTSYAQRNQLFRNTGRDDAGRVVFEERLFGRPASSRGLVVADFDNDGDSDLVVVEMDDRPTVLRNDTDEPGHWVGLLLIGAGGLRDAVGARATIIDSDGVVRQRELCSGGSYLSTGDPRLQVGLGAAAGALRSVTIRWPSGRTTVHRDLDIDRYWTLEESDSSSARVSGSGRSSSARSS